MSPWHLQIVMELPVEHGLLLDNLLDLAHAPFTHTSTFAKGWTVPRYIPVTAAEARNLVVLTKLNGQYLFGLELALTDFSLLLILHQLGEVSDPFIGPPGLLGPVPHRHGI